MKLGLLSCSKLKLPVPAPAWLMYSRSPMFSQQYQSLTSLCDEVKIVSALHSLVGTDNVLLPYDYSIKEMTDQQHRRWIRAIAGEVNAIGPESVTSYLSSGYAQIHRLIEAPISSVKGNFFKKSATIGSQGKLRRGEVLYSWPMEWLLIAVAERQRTLKELKNMLEDRYTSSATIQAQMYRIQKCPLHIVENGKVRNIYCST